MTENKIYTIIHLGNPVDCVIKDHTSDNTIGVFSSIHNPVNEVCDLLNEMATNCSQLKNENEQLKKDVEYWKQVVNQYNNEINVFKHKEQYKTECKDIYYSSD